MKKILMLVLPIVLLTACVDKHEDWNIDQKRASVVPARTLFTNALKNVTDALTTPNVNNNNYRMFVQYWATTTYLDEPRYNMTARLYSQNLWNSIYRDALSDLKEARRLVEEDASLVAGVKNNQLALIGILEVYCWNVLLNTFGDVPYSEALNPEISTPKYDDAAGVYDDVLSKLDASIAMLSTADASFGTADLLYNGSAAKWLKFGTSLKLKMGMLLADVNNTKAKSIVESAASNFANLIQAQADNARFPYISAPPNNNPISANLNPLFSSREDFVMANTIVNAMKRNYIHDPGTGPDPAHAYSNPNGFLTTVDDPRLSAYFTTAPAIPAEAWPAGQAQYRGGNYGFSNAYASFSHVSTPIIQPTFEALLMDYAEVEFLLAEAVERTYTIASGTAEFHYNAAVTASIAYWGGSATTYLLDPQVAYTTATGTYKQKIGRQKWIALNNRGWDSWVEWRRLDAPTLLPPSGPTIPNALSIPKRMIYPVNEQTVNGAKWAEAAANFNSDSPDASLFWDVN